MSAELIAINRDRPEFSGVHDPVAALIFCHVNQVDYSFINGKKVIDPGQLTTLNLPKLVSQNNQVAQSLSRL